MVIIKKQYSKFINIFDIYEFKYIHIYMIKK